ncbi:MAG: DMT family transporter [Gammaproteobacteria bacterium]
MKGPSQAGRSDTRARTHLRGIVMVTAAFCVLPALDGIAKYLIADFHVVQLVWARMFFQSILVAAWLAARGRLKFAPSERPVLLAGAIAVVWLANFPIIFSLAFLPLADAFALAMTAPLMVTALSATLLSERVDRHRWAAVAIGFCGALVIIRPGLGVFHWAAILPVLTAALFALYQIGMRRLTTTHTAIDLLLYASVAPMIASSVLVPLFWSSPDGFSWGLMALMGAGAGLGHFLLIAALDHAPASVLAPFMYIQLISSTLFGLIVFGDFPDTLTILGAAVIVASGLYSLRREYRSNA